MGKPRGAKQQQWSAAEDEEAEEDNTVSDAREDTLQTHTTTILAVIKETKMPLEAHITAVVTEVGILRDQQRKIVEGIKATEMFVADIAPTIKDLTVKTHQMEEDIKLLTGRLDDAEGCSRRHNVKIIGIQEQLGRPNVELFVENWLT